MNTTLVLILFLVLLALVLPALFDPAIKLKEWNDDNR